MNVISAKKNNSFLFEFFIMTNKNSPPEVYDPNTVMCRFTSLIYALPRTAAPSTALMNSGRNAKKRDVWMNVIDQLGHAGSRKRHFKRQQLLAAQHCITCHLFCCLRAWFC